MPFDKGNTLSKGRPKGAPNKTTAELRLMINQIISTNLETIQEDIKKLTPKNRIDVIINLLQSVGSVKPKPKVSKSDRLNTKKIN
jgi:23S rRNA C2498 (ribose-2'-O)-methylase RlmM